jgi:hypothetical protein
MANSAELYMTSRKNLDRVGDSMASGPTEESLLLLREHMRNAADMYAVACLEVSEKRLREAIRVNGRKG